MIDKYNIDRYFHLAKEQEPLLSLEEVQQLIEKQIPASKSKYNFKKIIVMTSILSMITASVLYLTSIPTQQQINVAAKEIENGNKQIAEMPVSKAISAAKPMETIDSKASETETSQGNKIGYQQLVNTQNIQLITLSNKELLKMGIKIDSTGIYLYEKNKSKIFEVSKDKPMRELFGDKNLITRKWASYIRYNNTSFENNKNKVATAPVIPAFVTDIKGEQWISYFINTPYYKANKDDESQQDSIKVMWNNIWSEADEQALDEKMTEKVKGIVQEKLSTLVPVLIYSGERFTKRDAELGRTRYGVILWYEASDKLFNALPAHISKGLRNDYEAITGVNTKATSNCEYFEVCKGNAGAVKKLMSYPNPVADQLHISFVLDQERSITLKLTDITGKTIKILSNDAMTAAGENKYDVNLSDVRDGMYLLYVQTNVGEYLTQRVMVKH